MYNKKKTKLQPSLPELLFEIKARPHNVYKNTVS